MRARAVWMVGLGLASCLGGWFAVRSLTRERAVAGSTQRAAAEGIVEHRAHAEADWSRVPYAAIPEDAAEASLLLDALLPGEIAGVAEGQRAALISLLAEQASARSRADPMAYMELAESDPNTRWVTAEDQPAFQVIQDVYAHHTGRDRADATSRDALLALVTFAIGQYDSRLVEVAADPEGVLVRTCRVRNRDEVWPKIRASLTDEAAAMWYRNNSTGQMFRVPRLSLDDACVRHGSVLVAQVNLLVKTESGRPFNWLSAWYWDEGTRTWLCHQMLRKGWHATMWY